MVQGERLDLGLTTFRWALSWSPTASPHFASTATSGVLTISVGDDEIWGREDGEWLWIDLLQWLVKSWPWLRSEDGLPTVLESSADSLRTLVEALEKKSRNLPPASRERAAMSLWNFRETHDLSRALNGADAPALMVWREGLLAHVLTGERRYKLRWSHVLECLDGLGDAISLRLDDVSPADDRSASLVAKWRARNSAKPGQILAIAREQDASNVVPLPAYWDNVDLGEIETSPVLAAARMTGRFSVALADRILREINELPSRTSSIATVAEAVLELVHVDETDAPYEQAYLYANAFRGHIGLSESAPFLADSWLREIGVLVRDIRLHDRGVEALAAWGPRNGPAILINLDGNASRTVGGRNATLAHEIGHLVMDRTSALPAAEVLAGRIDSHVESRARAFAAETLLPRAVARERLSQVASEAEARVAVNSLTRRYGVSRELAARQIENAGVYLHAEVFEYLRTLVRRR